MTHAPPPFQGETILSSDTTDFMRRISALQNLRSYTAQSQRFNSTAHDFNLQLACDFSGNIYSFGASPTWGLFKMPYDLSSSTTLSTYAGGPLAEILGLAANANYLWTTDRDEDTGPTDYWNRLSRLNFSGVIQASISFNSDPSISRFGNVSVFDDDRLLVEVWNISAATADLRLYTADLTSYSTVTTYTTAGRNRIFVLPDQTFVVFHTAGQYDYYTSLGVFIANVTTGTNTFVTGYLDNGALKTQGITAGRDWVFSHPAGNRLTESSVTDVSGVPGPFQLPTSSQVNELGDLFQYSTNNTIFYCTKDADVETTWYRYPTAGSDVGKVSLGTPDYGLTIPTANALQGFLVHYFELRDMRSAIENLAGEYYDDADNVPFIITPGIFTANIFFRALGGVLTDWETPTVTHGDDILGEFYLNLEEVIYLLENSKIV